MGAVPQNWAGRLENGNIAVRIQLIRLEYGKGWHCTNLWVSIKDKENEGDSVDGGAGCYTVTSSWSRNLVQLLRDVVRSLGIGEPVHNTAQGRRNWKKAKKYVDECNYFRPMVSNASTCTQIDELNVTHSTHRSSTILRTDSFLCCLGF